MTAEIPVRLLSRDQEEVAVGESLAALEIDLLLIYPNLPRVVRMAISVKVREDREIDAEAAKDGQPGRLFVDGSYIAQLLIEMEVEVAHQHFVARHWFVHIVVSERHHGLLRGTAVRWAQIEVDRHALLGVGRCIVERKIVQMSPRFTDSPIPHRVADAPGLRPDLSIG